MPIKPVDFQVAIPRTTEASRISSNDASKNLNVQQQSAENLRDKAEISLKQVYSRQKPEEARIKEKQRDSRGGGQQEGGKEKQEHEHKDSEGNVKSSRSNMPASTIDIKI